MQRRGLPIAFLMTAGNQAQTGLSEMALGLIEDERVTCARPAYRGLRRCVPASNGWRPGARTEEADHRDEGRPLRAGAARDRLATPPRLPARMRASERFLSRLGIARVDSIPAFIETLKLLHGGGPLPGQRLSSMSCSGGEASVMADSAEGRAVDFPSLAEAHRAAVSRRRSGRWSRSPIRWTITPSSGTTSRRMTRHLHAPWSSGGFDLNMLVLDFPRADRCSDADWWPTLDAFEVGAEDHQAHAARSSPHCRRTCPSTTPSS